METKRIPSEKSLDSSLALMREGYNFMRNRFEKFGSEIFKMRLMLKPVICLSGENAASLFYNNEYFIRKGAAPKRIQKTLLGEKGVQTLDDENHRKRKEAFMSLMSDEHLHRLINITQKEWKMAVESWTKYHNIIFFEAAQEILCRVACQWAGVPFKETELVQRSREFGAMVDAFGAVGSRHRKGKKARASAEKWIKDVITQIREGKIIPKQGTAAQTFAFYRENGELLSTKVAAVELINILRPIVAIGNYLTFAVHALHMYPLTRKKFQSGNKQYVEWFTHEVRRFYPFAPFVSARVRNTFVWNGYKFPKGRLVLLDVYGTNHDKQLWHRPEEFMPERFQSWKRSPFDFIPQGGGDHHSDHRCAGEWVTIEAMKVVIRILVNNIEYSVPEQDLSIDLKRMPTFPASHFVITNVKVKQKVPQMV